MEMFSSFTIKIKAPKAQIDATAEELMDIFGDEAELEENDVIISEECWEYPDIDDIKEELISRLEEYDGDDKLAQFTITGETESYSTGGHQIFEMIYDRKCLKVKTSDTYHPICADGYDDYAEFCEDAGPDNKVTEKMFNDIKAGKKRYYCLETTNEVVTKVIFNEEETLEIGCEEYDDDEEEDDGSDYESCEDKTFVITGKVHIFANRDEFTDYVEDNGGRVSGSVSKNTDFLVNNDINSTSSKNKKAKDMGIPIITEDEFVERFGGPLV